VSPTGCREVGDEKIKVFFDPESGITQIGHLTRLQSERKMTPIILHLVNSNDAKIL
jgi:hypothetical protein